MSSYQRDHETQQASAEFYIAHDKLNSQHCTLHMHTVSLFSFETKNIINAYSHCGADGLLFMSQCKFSPHAGKFAGKVKLNGEWLTSIVVRALDRISPGLESSSQPLCNCAVMYGLSKPFTDVSRSQTV